MTVVLLVEGDTETALKEHLKRFLDQRAILEGKPKFALRTKTIMPMPRHKLKRRVELELNEPGVQAVIALVDVFPEHQSATDAKQALLADAGKQPGFYAHAAQYDVEAWLLPYWSDICKRLGVTKQPPGANPELVDSQNPPAYRLQDLYRLAKPARKYTQPIEYAAILKGKDLTVAANQCPEFKSLPNTLLRLGGLQMLP